MSWAYERGAHRTKHCWNRDEAGFIPSNRGAIGKCPNTLDNAMAEHILNSGIEFRREENDPYPSHIYAVHKGVIYEAAPTQPGRSYHGYPWRGSMPRGILEKLQEMAQQQGFAREFEKWLREYGRG